MARRLSIALVALAAVLLQAGHARAQSPSILAQYSFDDSFVETGPDTFAIFQNAKGSVRLSWSDHFSGYRSIEIRDVSGDGDFPELQGYFPLRSHGTIYLHFALMIANPAEELNIALAGPGGIRPSPERHRLLAQDARRLSVPVLGQHAEEAVHAAAVRVVRRRRRVRYRSRFVRPHHPPERVDDAGRRPEGSGPTRRSSQAPPSTSSPSSAIPAPINRTSCTTSTMSSSAWTRRCRRPDSRRRVERSSSWTTGTSTNARVSAVPDRCRRWTFRISAFCRGTFNP